MQSRLSDEAISASLDAGHSNLLWKVPKPSGFLAGIDFKKVLENPNAAEIIQSMPVQPLLYAIKQQGLADSLDVLPLLSQEQISRIFDYDCWRKDVLEPRRVFDWLNALAQVSPQLMYERFADLEEEYQLAILGAYVRCYTEEETERMSQAEQDALFPMPCNTVFYSIDAETSDEVETIHNLIQATAEHDLRYAYALIGYASYIPPNEQEMTIHQFRRARLEEDGFISYEEGAALFAPIPIEPMVDRWSQRSDTELPANPEDNSIPFLDLVLRQAFDAGWDIDEQFNLHQGLLYVANSLCTVSQVEPEDVVGLNRVLEQVRALVGLALDYLSGGDPVHALEIVKVEHPKSLFRFSLSLVHILRKELLKQLENAFAEEGEKLSRLFYGQRWGAMVWQIDRRFSGRMGMEMVEVLKGLYNRYPMAPESIIGDNEKITFEPIASALRFARMHQYINGLAAWLQLVRMVEATEARSLEKALTTALVQAMVGGTFRFRPLSEAELQFFDKLSADEVKELMDKIQVEMAEQLVATREEWGVGAELGDVVGGIEYTMFFMKDYVMGLMFAKKSLTGDIRHLVISDSNEVQNDSASQEIRH